jgi:hypothetical protein
MSTTLEKLPSENLASAQFSAWLTAFNTQDCDTLLAYHEMHFPYAVASRDVQSIDHEIGLSMNVGGFDVADVVESDIGQKDVLTVILRERTNRRYAKARMRVGPDSEGHPVVEFDINPIRTPLKFVPDDEKEQYERALAPLTPERRRAVVLGIIDVIQERYINPAIGEKMINGLEKKLEEGEYDKFTDSEEFAKSLRDDTRALSGDKHIRIHFMEPPPKFRYSDEDDDKDGNKDEETKKVLPNLRDFFKERNFDFDPIRIESVGTNKIAILGIKGFVPSEFAVVREGIGEIMSRIADADALIIDLRFNHGGHPNTVALIESYLLGDDNSDGIHLLDFVDRNGNADRSFSTLPSSKLWYPPDTQNHRFGPSKPLFVLTSKETVAGGEHMAYDLQTLKRARAIISADKATAGVAGISGPPRFVAEEEFGKMWWNIGIPGLTPRSAITHGNWVDVGVISDVVVGRNEDPLDVAKAMAKEALESN